MEDVWIEGNFVCIQNPKDKKYNIRIHKGFVKHWILNKMKELDNLKSTMKEEVQEMYDLAEEAKNGLF